MNGPIDTPLEEPRRSADVLDGIAFQFCKVATVALIAGRFTLPVAALLCSGFYICAYVKGKRESRCLLRYPLLIAATYGTIGIVSLVMLFHR